MNEPEVWLRGPLPGVPALLKRFAHSLLLCREVFAATLRALTAAQLWARPGGAASVGFHLRHAAGSLDRLFTYARGERLSRAQLAALATEGDEDTAPGAAQALLAALDEVIARALEQLRSTKDASLLETRGVGRAQLPSTVLGLLFHGAEHTQRHAGQAVTTARIVRSQ